MKIELKKKQISPLHILIDFFASLYDLIYDNLKFSMETIMKSILKIKKSPKKVLIDFFAFQYDMAYDFIIFLQEYIKWITDIHSNNSADFTKQAKESIQIENQTHFDIR